MRQSSWVDHDACAVLARGMDGIEQDALMIALHRSHLKTARSRSLAHESFNVSESVVAVNGGFANAEEVEVWAVDEEEAASGSHDITIAGVVADTDARVASDAVSRTDLERSSHLDFGADHALEANARRDETCSPISGLGAGVVDVHVKEEGLITEALGPRRGFVKKQVDNS